MSSEAAHNLLVYRIASSVQGYKIQNLKWPVNLKQVHPPKMFKAMTLYVLCAPYLIHSQVNPSIGYDPYEAGGQSTVETSQPLPLQYLLCTVQHAPVLPGLAKSKSCL